MKKFSKEDLAELIDMARLKGFVDDKMDMVSSVTSMIRPKNDEGTKNALKIIKTVVIIVGVVACIAAIAYAVYRYVTPDYDDVFDDDFDDAFDDDDDDLFEEEKPASKGKKK